MRSTALALLTLALLAASTGAADDKPTLPHVPRGFDEGRTAFVEETADGLVAPGALVERLFEEADLTDIATFIYAHLLTDEKRDLGQALGLANLGGCKDAGAVQTMLGDRKPAEVTKALGGMLVARKYTLG